MISKCIFNYFLPFKHSICVLDICTKQRLTGCELFICLNLQMRVASVTLAKVYMKRALKEITAYTGGGNEAALVAQSVRFTYRVHQVCTTPVLQMNQG